MCVAFCIDCRGNMVDSLCHFRFTVTEIARTEILKKLFVKPFLVRCRLCCDLRHTRNKAKSFVCASLATDNSFSQRRRKRWKKYERIEHFCWVVVILTEAKPIKWNGKKSHECRTVWQKWKKKSWRIDCWMELRAHWANRRMNTFVRIVRTLTRAKLEAENIRRRAKNSNSEKSQVKKRTITTKRVRKNESKEKNQSKKPSNLSLHWIRRQTKIEYAAYGTSSWVHECDKSIIAMNGRQSQEHKKRKLLASQWKRCSWNLFHTTTNFQWIEWRRCCRELHLLTLLFQFNQSRNRLELQKSIFSLFFSFSLFSVFFYCFIALNISNKLAISYIFHPLDEHRQNSQLEWSAILFHSILSYSTFHFRHKI